MAELGEIDSFGPSSVPRYFLEVFWCHELSAEEFSTQVMTFQQSLFGLVTRFGIETFLPSDYVISAGYKQEDDEFREDSSLHAILHNSAPEMAAIARIGSHADRDEEWTTSVLYLNGKAVSKMQEEEIVAKYEWLDRSFLHSGGYPLFGYEEAAVM
jgi:hypothetical protein